MEAFLDKFDGGELIGLFAVVGGIIFLTAATLSQNWRRARQAEIEAALKQDMLNRGMSAQEIATVLRAGKKKKKSHACSNTGE